MSSVKIIQGRKFSRLVFDWLDVRHDVLVWADSAVYISTLLMMYGSALNLSDDAETYTMIRNISNGYHEAMKVF